jgi:hypothetical protein
MENVQKNSMKSVCMSYSLVFCCTVFESWLYCGSKMASIEVMCFAVLLILITNIYLLCIS